MDSASSISQWSMDETGSDTPSNVPSQSLQSDASPSQSLGSVASSLHSLQSDASPRASLCPHASSRPGLPPDSSPRAGLSPDSAQHPPLCPGAAPHPSLLLNQSPEIQASDEPCAFCEFGRKVQDVCGKLYTQKLDSGELAAHKKCMQYSSKLVQYKFNHFGGFEIEEVQAEIKRGKRLKCFWCKQKKKRMMGATSGCELRECPKSFHFFCARTHPTSTTCRRRRQGKKGEDLYWVFCSKQHEREYKESTKGQQEETCSETSEESDYLEDHGKEIMHEESAHNSNYMKQKKSPKSQKENGKASKSKRHRVRAWGEKNMPWIKNAMTVTDSDSDSSVFVRSLSSSDLSDTQYSSGSFGSKLSDLYPSTSQPSVQTHKTSGAVPTKMAASQSQQSTKHKRHRFNSRRRETSLVVNSKPHCRKRLLSTSSDELEEENSRISSALKAQTRLSPRTKNVSLTQLMESRKNPAARGSSGSEVKRSNSKVAGPFVSNQRKIANRAKHFTKPRKQSLHKQTPQRQLGKKQSPTLTPKNLTLTPKNESQRLQNSLPSPPFDVLFCDSPEAEDSGDKSSEQGEAEDSDSSSVLASAGFAWLSGQEPVPGKGDVHQAGSGRCEPEPEPELSHNGEVEPSSSAHCALQECSDPADVGDQASVQPELGCSHQGASCCRSDLTVTEGGQQPQEVSMERSAKPEGEKTQSDVEQPEKPGLEMVNGVCDDQKECVLVIPEDASAFRDVAQEVQQMLWEKHRVETRHMHTWNVLHSPHLLPADCRLYYFHDLARAMEYKRWDELEKLLVDASAVQEKLDTSYKKFKMKSRSAWEVTRTQHMETYRQLITGSMAEACRINSYLMGTLTSRADVYFIIFFISNICDPEQTIRSALHHSRVHPLDPGHAVPPPFHSLLPTHLCDYMLLESTVLLKWFQQNFSEDPYRLACLPEERVFRLDSGESNGGFDRLKSKLTAESSSKEDVPVIILMYRIKASLIHFENYLQACLSQYAKCSGRLHVACVFPVENLRERKCPQIQLESHSCPVKFFSAFNPSHKPVSMLVAEVRREFEEC